jgi:hypothetical protein
MNREDIAIDVKVQNVEILRGRLEQATKLLLEYDLRGHSEAWWVRVENFIASKQEDQHTCKNCLGVDPESCMFKHPEQAEGAQGEREAFEAYRDRRNALLESEGHKPGSKWHVTQAHYPTWEASRAALAQPSPAPELERLIPDNIPRFVLAEGRMSQSGSGTWMRDSWLHLIQDQHDRIVGALQQQKSEWVRRAEELGARCDATLVRVAELEAQYGGVCLWRQDGHWFSIECGGSWSRDDTRDSPPSCCINCGKETHILSPFYDGKQWQKAPTFEEGRAKLPKAAAQAGQVPVGFALVPLEPTAEMREAFHESYERYEDGVDECPDDQWKAMLAAAPAQGGE